MNFYQVKMFIKCYYFISTLSFALAVNTYVCNINGIPCIVKNNYRYMVRFPFGIIIKTLKRVYSEHSYQQV